MEKFTNLNHFVTSRGRDRRFVPKYPVLLFIQERDIFILSDEEQASGAMLTEESLQKGYHFDRFNFTDKELVEIDSITYLISFLKFGSYGTLTLTIL